MNLSSRNDYQASNRNQDLEAEILPVQADDITLAQIDSRAFHAFAFHDGYFLFDRASASLLGVDEAVYSAFALLETGMGPGKLETALANSISAGEIERINQLASNLYERGMLRFVEVDRPLQKKKIGYLMEHKSIRIQLLMAQGCNLGCRYCYAWRNGSNQKETLMSFETAKKSVDFLVERSGQRRDLMVTFFGGEPLLNYPILKRVVAYCKSISKSKGKNFTFELITNGTLLDEKVTRFIVRHKFLLFISIDGDEDMHNYNRPSMDRSNRYSEILANAMHATEEYGKNGLGMPKIRANLTKAKNDYLATGEYLNSKGFYNIGIAAIEPLPHGDKSPSALTEDQMDELQESSFGTVSNAVEMLARGEEPTYFVKNLVQKYIRQSVPSSLRGLSCGVGRNTATVDNKGDIFPCHRYEGMENYVLGNVESGMDPARTLDYYNKVNDNAMARCHSCWIRDYCSGGCAWLLSAKDGHIADPTKRECDRRRRSMEHALWLRQRVRKVAPSLLTDEDRDSFRERADDFE